MPLPTNLAFHAFYLPVGFLKLTTVFVNLSELLCPWLFFAPVRSLRIFSFYWQLFLQICIIVTGNYGFLNFLVVTMLLALLDDNHFKSSTSTGTSLKKIISFVLTVAAIFSIFIVTMTFYQIKYENSELDVKICKYMLIDLCICVLIGHNNFSIQEEGIPRLVTSNG